MALTIIMALIAISSGSSGLPLNEVMLTLLGKGTENAARIVWNIRMPRIVTAVTAGAGLAVVGCVMQGILRNPLASSSTLGVSQGAAFGASIAIIYFGAGVQGQIFDGVTIINPYMISICAFLSSMSAAAVILALSRFKKISPEAMILCGVALSFLFSGGTTLMQYFADDVKVAAVVFWTFGDLGRTSWREASIIAAVVSISLAYFSYNSWNYNVLQGGQHTAKGLGVNVDGLRVVGMIICSLSASIIVSFVGIINFIGLIAPHLVRRLVGSDYRYLLPASAGMGAFLLLLSDTAARLAAAPVILPIGAITSFFGAPMFLYLLFRGLPR
ncbi:MAG: iron ABC transporter permease [Clostridia bacterium]|nr:iron ABC transporter permease [Clostridia bacterium]